MYAAAVDLLCGTGGRAVDVVAAVQLMRRASEVCPFLFV
jgi:hypothetical protein